MKDQSNVNPAGLEKIAVRAENEGGNDIVREVHVWLGKRHRLVELLKEMVVSHEIDAEILKAG